MGFPLLALLANPAVQTGIGLALTAPAIPGMIQGGGELIDEFTGSDVMGKRARSSKIRDAALSNMLAEDQELGRQEALQYIGGNMLGTLNPGYGNRLSMYSNTDYEAARRMGLENTIQSNANVLRQLSSTQSPQTSLADLALAMGL